EQVSPNARAVGEDGSDTGGILLHVSKRHAETIAFRRQRIAQRAIEAPPRAHGAHRFGLEVGLAGAIEEDERVEANSHRLVEIDPETAQDADELRMRAEPGAAPGEILRVALEDDSVPADAAQKTCCEQPAERTADHQGTSSDHDWLGDAGLMPWPTRGCVDQAWTCGLSVRGWC